MERTQPPLVWNVTDWVPVLNPPPTLSLAQPSDLVSLDPGVLTHL